MLLYCFRVTEMGCYGIGVTRLLAASVEALSTEKFIRWPRCIAPFNVIVIPQKVCFFIVSDLLSICLQMKDTYTCALESA